MKISDELPSIKNLENELNALGYLSIFLPKKQREEFKSIKRKLKNMTLQVEKFNEHFSDLGWCTYDSISIDLLEKANSVYEQSGLDLAEEVLVKYYHEDIRKIVHLVKYKSKEFEIRYDLFEKAFEDHINHRYYASIPLFLIIVDGAVNDFTKSKGFWTDETETNAWDCLVGCSDGLTKVKQIFNKGIRKTITDEIRLPYRNGILHGRCTNYANKYVSSKCVVLIFAILDWMQMVKSEDSRRDKLHKSLNPPPISESIAKHKKNLSDAEMIKKWLPNKMIIGETIPASGDVSEYEKYPYCHPVIEMLILWQSRNYGKLSEKLKILFNYEPNEKIKPQLCREMFSDKILNNFQLLSVEETMCIKTHFKISLNFTKNDQVVEGIIELNSMYEKDSFNLVVYPWNDDGCWCIYPTDFKLLYN